MAASAAVLAGLAIAGGISDALKARQQAKVASMRGEAMVQNYRDRIDLIEMGTQAQQAIASGRATTSSFEAGIAPGSGSSFLSKIQQFTDIEFQKIQQTQEIKHQIRLTEFDIETGNIAALQQGFGAAIETGAALSKIQEISETKQNTEEIDKIADSFAETSGGNN